MSFSRTSIFLAVVCLWCCILATAQTKDPKPSSESKPIGQLKTKYDKSRDLTTVSLKTLALSSSMTKEVTNLREVPQLDLDVFFTHPGQVVTKPVDNLIFKFRGRARNPVFQRGQNVMVVLDEERALMLGEATYTSSSQTFYFDEFLTISIPYEVAKRIASARTLKFYLGPREIKVTPDQQADFHTIIERMTP